MGRNDWSIPDPTQARQMSKDFIVKAINMYVAHGFDFALWQYHDDHTMPAGIYDQLLDASNYVP